MTTMTEVHDLIEDAVSDKDEPVHIVPFLEDMKTALTIDGKLYSFCGKEVDKGIKMPNEEVPLENVCVACLEAVGKLGLHYNG